MQRTCAVPQKRVAATLRAAHFFFSVGRRLSDCKQSDKYACICACLCACVYAFFMFVMCRSVRFSACFFPYPAAHHKHEDIPTSPYCCLISMHPSRMLHSGVASSLFVQQDEVMPLASNMQVALHSGVAVKLQLATRSVCAAVTLRSLKKCSRADIC